MPTRRKKVGSGITELKHPAHLPGGEDVPLVYHVTLIFCCDNEIAQFHSCFFVIKAYNVARSTMATRPLQNNTSYSQLRRNYGEKPDGWMFFVLPPALLALVFIICAMASEPAASGAPAARAEKTPPPTAAAAEPAATAAAEPAPSPADAAETQPTSQPEVAADSETDTPDTGEDDFEDGEFVEDEE